MSLIAAILIPIILACLLTFANTITEVWVGRIHKRRALKKLKDDRHVFVGANIREIRMEGSDRSLIGECTITMVRLGCVEVCSGDITMVFTAQEFEKLHPKFIHVLEGEDKYGLPKGKDGKACDDGIGIASSPR